MTPEQIIEAIDELKSDAKYLGNDVTWHLDADTIRLRHLASMKPKYVVIHLDAARDHLIAFERECIKSGPLGDSLGRLRVVDLAHRACQLSRECEALARRVEKNADTTIYTEEEIRHALANALELDDDLAAAHAAAAAFAAHERTLPHVESADVDGLQVTVTYKRRSPR